MINYQVIGDHSDKENGFFLQAVAGKTATAKGTGADNSIKAGTIFGRKIEVDGIKLDRSSAIDFLNKRFEELGDKKVDVKFSENEKMTITKETSLKQWSLMTPKKIEQIFKEVIKQTENVVTELPKEKAATILEKRFNSISTNYLIMSNNEVHFKFNSEQECKNWAKNNNHFRKGVEYEITDNVLNMRPGGVAALMDNVGFNWETHNKIIKDEPVFKEVMLEVKANRIHEAFSHIPDKCPTPYVHENKLHFPYKNDEQLKLLKEYLRSKAGFSEFSINENESKREIILDYRHDFADTQTTSEVEFIEIMKEVQKKYIDNCVIALQKKYPLEDLENDEFVKGILTKNNVPKNYQNIILERLNPKAI